MRRRGDGGEPISEAGHDGAAFGLVEATPGGDLMKGAAAPNAQAVRAVHGADFNAGGAGRWRRVHDAELGAGRGGRKRIQTGAGQHLPSAGPTRLTQGRWRVNLAWPEGG